MDLKKLISLLVVVGLLCSFVLPTFAETRKELMGQLTEAKKTFITERDKLHDQDRTLRIAWHEERGALYKQAKESPKDKSIKQKLNEGAKKFLTDKKEVYRKLEQQRKDWLALKGELKTKIKAAK